MITVESERDRLAAIQVISEIMKQRGHLPDTAELMGETLAMIAIASIQIGRESSKDEIARQRAAAARARMLVEHLVERLKQCGEWPAHNECSDRDSSQCLRCGLDTELDQLESDRRWQG